jgi:hypothetical protein
MAIFADLNSKECTKAPEELKIKHMERIFRGISPEVTAAYDSLRRQVIDRFASRRDLLSGELSSRQTDNQELLKKEFNSWTWDAYLVHTVQNALWDHHIVGSVREEQYYWWKWAMAMRRCANERFRPLRHRTRRNPLNQQPRVEPGKEA